MFEKIPRNVEKGKTEETLPTAMQTAFVDAEHEQMRKEEILGEALGNDIWDILSDPEKVKKLSENTFEVIPPKGNGPLIQVDTKPGLATEWQKDEAPQGREMPRAVLADTGPLVQVETREEESWDDFLKRLDEEDRRNNLGVASKTEVPVRDGPADNPFVDPDDPFAPIVLDPHLGSLMVGAPEDTTFHHNEIRELDSYYPDHLAPAHVRKEYFDLDAAVKESIASGDEEAQRIAIERLDTFMTEQAEGIHLDEVDVENEEGTRSEWKTKLKGLVERVVETTKNWGSSEEHFVRRNAELDARIENIGSTEKYFRAMGEKYNKLPFKYKVALGASLGLGAVFTAGTLTSALPLLGLASQRIAGLSTMYLKFEKKSHDEKWGKEKAMLKAGVYTVLMGWTMRQAIEFASETELAHSAQAKVIDFEKWLGSKLGYSAPVLEVSEGQTEVPKAPASAPEAPKPAAAASAPEVPAKAPLDTAVKPASTETPQTKVTPEAAETPVEVDVSAIKPIEASSGHGYEYMMKRLWEQLQQQNIKLPENAGDSDLARLLSADEKSINSVVHKLAEEKGWYKPDGTSVRIALDSGMTINSEGEISIEGEVSAPEDAPMTPVYHVETEASATPSVGGTEASDRALDQYFGTEVPLKTLDVVEIKSQVVGPGVEVAPSQVQPEAPSASENFIVNKFNLEISTTKPHLYEDEVKSLFVYGGSEEEKNKLITDYLTENTQGVIYAEDANAHRVAWYRELAGKGKITQSVPMPTTGFPSFFSSFMKAPTPDEFRKLIK